MAGKEKVRLSSAELASLWSTYENETMMTQMMTYFINKTTDSRIRNVLSDAQSINDEHIKYIQAIYKSESHPIPRGFDEDDVDPGAEQLFSETFFLNFVHNMSRTTINVFGDFYSSSARADIVQFFDEALDDQKKLYKKTLHLLLEMGIYTRPAFLPPPKRIDFVNKQNYFNGWFGEKRPLNAMEIANLYIDIQRNGIGKALLLGFEQVAQAKKVRDYMNQGVKITNKNVELMARILAKEDVNVPPTWDSDVLNAKGVPFSDRLVTYLIAVVGSLSISLYGTSLGRSFRSDITAVYMRIIAEALKYEKEGVDLLISESWLEQPPSSKDNPPYTSE